MGKKKGRPAVDCTILSEYPQASVPEHCVLLSFASDEQAALFTEWWYSIGPTHFGIWLDCPQDWK